MSKAKTKRFTDLWIKDRLPYAGKGKQDLYWDTSQKGLALLVGSHTKTFRSRFQLNGRWITRTLKRFDDVKPKDGGEDPILAWARDQVRKDRADALKGIDPREGEQAQQQKTEDLTFGAVVDLFIELYAKPRHRTWDQTERVLKNYCAPWLKKKIADITVRDAYKLLDGFVRDGNQAKAAVTKKWLKTFWKWSWKRDYVPVPIMEKVDVETEKRVRDRVFTDQEIKATWDAANKLAPDEAAYIKLLILLAPRKTSLAYLSRSQLDDAGDPTLWTVPLEHTKSKKTLKDEDRTYLIPLPPLARRIIKPVLKTGRLFPSLPTFQNKADRPWFNSGRLTKRLIKGGAPKDFQYHAWRHTIATFLKNAGHSKWERGLVLNHAESGVTADYSHGYPLELKLKLLTTWADHVEGLVQPMGAVLLR